MAIKNYYDVAQDLKASYYSLGRIKRSSETIGDKDELFWEFLNLAHLTANNIDMEKSSGSALLILGAKFINHISVTYQMLTQSMVDEYFIMVRQSCEVFWLAQYFVKHPEKESDWISSKENYIAPKVVRASIDENKKMRDIYNYLSANAHPKTTSISNILTEDGLSIFGNFDKHFVESGLYILLKLIDEFIETYINVLIDQNNIDFTELAQKMKDGKFNETEEIYILIVGQYSVLTEKLDEFKLDE